MASSRWQRAIVLKSIFRKGHGTIYAYVYAKKCSSCKYIHSDGLLLPYNASKIFDSYTYLYFVQHYSGITATSLDFTTCMEFLLWIALCQLCANQAYYTQNYAQEYMIMSWLFYYEMLSFLTGKETAPIRVFWSSLYIQHISNQETVIIIMSHAIEIQTGMYII